MIDASEIEVQVQNREVTLTGTVRDRNERRRAEDLAESVSGVSHVQNNLRVGQRQGAHATGTEAGDAAHGDRQSRQRHGGYRRRHCAWRAHDRPAAADDLRLAVHSLANADVLPLPVGEGGVREGSAE